MTAAFEVFFADVGPRPNGYSLDRKNVNGDYEPGNVRWANKYVQANNQRPKRKAILDRIKLLVVLRQNALCSHCGILLGPIDAIAFDHRPAIALREIDHAHNDYVPAQLNSDYIEAVHRDCHNIRTFGKPATTAGSDIGNIAKAKRLAKRGKITKPKRKIPSRPFAKGQRSIHPVLPRGRAGAAGR